MIEIRYLQAESGANKFGTCNCCGKSSGEDPLMISIKFSYYGHGTLICLCDDCKKKLMEALPPVNNSEIPNSSDIIHCKDCKYFKQVFAPNDNDGLCGHWHSKCDARTSREGYCSHAERKQNDTERC